ncbi:hypothetical protein NP493_925g00000 [Ridgeia piscesae]|uniref:Uncharacterized protein n=1 Tax=Ridgeia piscesae TaxID=27915 RepID=A0AAD9KK17_RIDPI|nr:hypothetical protein NP493_925g00000 [Ridgeia piscesae]
MVVPGKASLMAMKSRRNPSSVMTSFESTKVPINVSVLALRKEFSTICRRLPLNSTSYKLPLGARYVMERARRMTNVYSQMGVRQISAVTTTAVTSRRQTTTVCMLSRLFALLHSAWRCASF